MWKYQRGVTLLETMVVAAIFLILAAYGVFSLTQSQQSTSGNTQIQTILTDIKNQQIKAMVGDTEGRTSRDYYGIHFGTSSYTLFHGSTYNANDSSNFVINLDSNYSFTGVTFPSNNLIFIPVNGEVYGYSSIANSFSLQNNLSKVQTQVKVNYLGVITTIQ